MSLTSTSGHQVLPSELGGLLLVITLTQKWVFGPERTSVDRGWGEEVIRALAGMGKGQIILFVQNGKLWQKRLGKLQP